MTKKLKTFANELININLHIKKLYDKLYEYELNGENNPEKLNELMENLKIFNSVLDKFYDKENLNINKCKELLDYFYNQNTNDSEKIAINKKIIMKLNSMISNLFIQSEIEIDNEEYDKLKKLGCKNPNEFIRKGLIKNKIELEHAIEKDILSEYLYFIEELIKNLKYKKYKNKLIYAKYNLSFICKDVEDLMLAYSFKVPDKIYLSSKMLSQFLDSETEYDYYRNNYAEELCNSLIMDLLSVKEEDYIDEDTVISALMKQSLLRAAFQLLDDKNLNDINYDFHESVDNNKDNEISNQSIEYITNGFKSIKNDKNKKLILTLKK